PIADVRNRSVLVAAEQRDQGGQEVGAGRDTAEVEVQDDPDAPVRIGDEGVHGRTSGGWVGAATAGAGLVRSRQANKTPSALSTAVRMLQREDGGTPRLGSLGSAGRPYVSGLSSRR